MRPYLLSTRATLKRCSRQNYRGYDFRLDSNRHRSYAKEYTLRYFKDVFFGVIIPNAIICRESGMPPEFQDILRALDYAMAVNKSVKTRKIWFETLRESKREWTLKYISRPAYYYGMGMGCHIKKVTKELSPNRIPKDKLCSLAEYVSEKMDREKVKELPMYAYTSTPALTQLIDAYLKEPGIAKMKISELTGRFGCSKRTVNKFRQFLKETETDGICLRNLSGLKRVVRKHKEVTDEGHEEDTGRTAG